VHRDIKPDNIMVKRDGEICVLDLGLATHLDEPDHRPAGTPGYVAPEQREGGTVTERSDIFSLGCVLFEMMVMTLPYPHETGFAPEQKTPFDSVSLDTMNPRLRDLGLAMIAWRPADRPARMSEVLDALRPMLPGPTTPRPAPATEPDPALWYWKFRRGN
jgi:serine/threonine-protein kinase